MTVDSATRNFAQAVTLGTSTTDHLSVTIQELNTLLLDELGVPANEASQLEVRVTSSVGDTDPLVSEAVGLSITPYVAQALEPEVPEEPEPEPNPDVTVPARLWVPGEYQNWDPAAAPTIRAVADSVYEGYVYLSMPTGYKFTSDPDWDHTNYGDAGMPNTLTIDGTAPSLGTDTPGYYRFIVNTEDLTYSADLINTWGIIGTATAGGWDSSTPMTFDADTQTWTVTADLVVGALKFRANDAWDINLGPEDSEALVGRLIQTDDAISVSEDGSYTVTIDLGTTDSPYDYVYDVVKN